MPLLFSRPLDGPGTHALVVGVGSYPDAKPGRGVRPSLRSVADLPSAADSAKLMCDWLLAHKDEFQPPLATIDVLISDPVTAGDRYHWVNPQPDAATVDNVRVRGAEWYQRVIDTPGNAAFFYCCGHGASHANEPVLFLENLNQDFTDPWSHINLKKLAQSLIKEQDVSTALLLSDACSEFVSEFELGRSQDCRFFAEPELFLTSRNQVCLVCAATEGTLAYEGEDRPGGSLKFGRFTQTLLKGLEGSSARFSGNHWAVPCRDLIGDLKALRRIFFDHWSEAPFEPLQAVSPTDPLPLVFPKNFELPVVVMTQPFERMRDYLMRISDSKLPASPWIRERIAGDASAWVTTVPPGEDVLYAIAVNADGHYPSAFMPHGPLFQQLVKLT